MSKKTATKAKPKKVAAKPIPKATPKVSPKPTKSKPIATKSAASAPKTVAAKVAAPKAVAPKPVAQKPAAPKAVAPPATTHRPLPPKPAPMSAKPPVVAPKVVAPPAPLLPKPRPVNESPPVDHGAALLPLFLSASHGYLSRPVDESWSDALAKYRKALHSAVEYEAKRSPESRSAMAAFVHQKVSTLLNQLHSRLQQVRRDLTAPDVNDAQSAALRLQSRRLTKELRDAVDLLQDAVGPQKLLKGLPPQAILTTSVLSWLARVADFERST